MAADIRNHLRWLVRPRLFGIVHLCIIYLWVGYHTCNAGFNAFLESCNTAEKRRLLFVGERTAEGIAYLVRERCDARHLLYVGFEGKFFGGVGAGSGSPTLAVDEDIGVD